MSMDQGIFEMVKCDDCGKVVNAERSKLYPYGDVDELAIEILCPTCYEERCDWDDYQEEKRRKNLFRSQLNF